MYSYNADGGAPANGEKAFICCVISTSMEVELELQGDDPKMRLMGGGMFTIVLVVLVVAL